MIVALTISLLYYAEAEGWSVCLASHYMGAVLNLRVLLVSYMYRRLTYYAVNHFLLSMVNLVFIGAPTPPCGLNRNFLDLKAQ